MREYHVHFSFYSEEYGSFDDISYRIMANTPFEARELAWPVCDKDEDTPLRGNIRQFAVTWAPNMLDAGDYFYSHAAAIKQSLGRLMNVSIPNDRISGGESRQRIEAERCSNLGALYTLDDVAKDLYADKGMIPPSVYEELHYAEKLCGHLGWGERADALWERMEKAKKWDRGAIYSIRELFKDGYTTLCGEAEVFREQFGRNGIYPVHNNLDEHDYTYISRWLNKGKVAGLGRLPFYKETDVIQNSAGHMDYGWQTLLLDRRLLNEGYQTPENQLWRTADPSEQSMDAARGTLLVENLITGQCIKCDKDHFLGVLRPDIAARLDLDALKEEYAATHSEDVANVRVADGYSAGTEADEDELDR